MVREYARKAGIDKLAPHNLRRTCARLCHAAGGSRPSDSAWVPNASRMGNSEHTRLAVHYRLAGQGFEFHRVEMTRSAAENIFRRQSRLFWNRNPAGETKFSLQGVAPACR